MSVSKLGALLARTLLVTVGCGLGLFLLAIAIVKIEPAFRTIPLGFDESSPAVGDMAPDFTIRDVHGAEFRFVEHLGWRPIVIEFGSLTCPYCTGQISAMRGVAEKYRGRAEFIFIYCAEAHAGEAPPVTTWEARRERAREIQRFLGDSVRVLVDEFADGSIQRRYKSLANSAFALGSEGRVIGKLAIAQADKVDDWLYQALRRSNGKEEK